MKQIVPFALIIIVLEASHSFARIIYGRSITCRNLYLTTFPSSKCTNDTNFTKLDLSHNNIRRIKQGMFNGLGNLTDLYLAHNGLEGISKGSLDGLRSLRTLKLKGNSIKKIPEFTVKSTITYLDLRDNPLTEISASGLINYPELRILDLSGTKILRLPSNVFRYNPDLQELYLTNTPLEYLDEDAFEGISLLRLSVNATKITSLPSKGVRTLSFLDIRKAINLWQLPFKSFEKLIHINVEYHFHCCLLSKQHDPYVATPNFDNFTQLPPCNDTEPSPFPSDLTTTTIATPTTLDNDDPFNKFKDRFPVLKNTTLAKPTPKRCSNQYHNELPTLGGPRPVLVCLPQPDAFNPCEDILGTDGLRACSWLVAIFATLGNGFQLIVLANSRRNSLMYRVLMSNLAVANFFMGIYLGMIATADACTYGEYQNHARAWQFGTGCNAAGFLSILSTELAVYTLTIITLERYYTIVHPLKNDMHLSIKQVGTLMTCGWLFALTLATLPLVGISSYQKVAVCLPFDVGNPVSTAYVTFLLITNGIAFLSVLFCYARMYCSLGGARCSSAARVEGRVAKRMALLVLSNFSCWFPIALFGLIAIYGNPVINVPSSKFLLVFIYPINAFTNPYLYALGTKHFQLDVLDLIKRFGFCQRRIDKLSNKLLDQLASLPNTSKANTGSRSSLNSFRVSPHSSFNGKPSDGKRRSTRSKLSTNSRDSRSSCIFLSIPSFPCGGQDKQKRYSSDLDSMSANGDCAFETPETEPLKPGTRNGRLDLKLRRSSAREVIIAGSVLSKISCDCKDAKHPIRECHRQTAGEMNDNESPVEDDEWQKQNGGYVPSVMITSC